MGPKSRGRRCESRCSREIAPVSPAPQKVTGIVGMATMVYGISDSDAIESGWTTFAGVMLMALPLTSIVTLAPS